MLASKADLELENTNMLYQIEDLKAKANKLKRVNLENLKYKVQEDFLIKFEVVRNSMMRKCIFDINWFKDFEHFMGLSLVFLYLFYNIIIKLWVVNK